MLIIEKGDTAADSGASNAPSDVAADDLDRQLTLAFQRGEKDAYEGIHQRHAARVESLCRRMLGNPDDAKEAAQETFLRTYQALARFNGRYRIGPWITRIATNVCLDQLRARARWRLETLPAERIELEPRGFDETADPAIIHIRRTEGRRVYRLLASLPPLHRAAIVLRDFEGLSYEEIATALQITECQVKALLHRARKGFRRSWDSGRLAGLVSLRWLRRVQDGARDHAGQGVTATHTADIAASVSNFAASCSVSLHSCGQMLSERAATLVTTVALSAAAVTGMTASLPASPAGAGPATLAVGAPAGPAAADAGSSIQTQISAEERASMADTSATDESSGDEPTMEPLAPPAVEPEAPAPAAEPTPPSEPSASEEPAPPSEPSPSESEEPPPPSDPPPSEPPAYEEPPPSSEPPPSEPPASDESPPASDRPPPTSDGPPADPQPTAPADPPAAGG